MKAEVIEDGGQAVVSQMFRRGGAGSNIDGGQCGPAFGESQPSPNIKFLGQAPSSLPAIFGQLPLPPHTWMDACDASYSSQKTWLFLLWPPVFPEANRSDKKVDL